MSLYLYEHDSRLNGPSCESSGGFWPPGVEMNPSIRLSFGFLAYGLLLSAFGGGGGSADD